MKSKIKKFIKILLNFEDVVSSRQRRIAKFLAAGSIPWSDGYWDYKWQQIENSINSDEILHTFECEKISIGYGKLIDERIVEYPWLLSRILKGKGKFLDAGSTFNFDQILIHPVLQEKDIYIYTYFPEKNNFLNKRISYVFGDLRELPFKDDYFEHVVCHSTLEHIDMDNSLYGYELAHRIIVENPSYEFLRVVKELIRVVKPGGQLLLTFPYGKFENHGFFQQFNSEMVSRIEDTLEGKCYFRKSFAKYDLDGWQFTVQEQCEDSVSYNPHSGQGKGLDSAAHSRAICFIEVQKNNTQ
jgi:SAM-dependent methyltransferase